jgi:hypothetical protein
MGPTPNNDSDDDAPAFEAAMNAVANGGQIDVPPGRYGIRTPIDDNDAYWKLSGAGGKAKRESCSATRGSAIRTLTAGMTAFSIGASRTNVSHLGPVFEDINVYRCAGSAETGIGVRIRLHNEYAFERFSVGGDNGVGFEKGVEIVSDSSSRGGSISGGDASWGMVSHSAFTNNRYGWYITHSGGVLITGSSFSTGSQPDDSNTAVWTNGGGQFRFIGNKVDQGTGLDLGSVGAQISNNQFEDCDPYAIRINKRSTGGTDSGQRNNISENFFTADDEERGVGIRIEGGAVGNKIGIQEFLSYTTGMQIQNQGSATERVTTSVLPTGYSQ